MDGIGTIAALGGILLVVLLAFAGIMNRRRSAADRRRTEEATKELYARVDREDKITDPDPKSF